MTTHTAALPATHTVEIRGQLNTATGDLIFDAANAVKWAGTAGHSNGFTNRNRQRAQIAIGRHDRTDANGPPVCLMDDTSFSEWAPANNIAGTVPIVITCT